MSSKSFCDKCGKELTIIDNRQLFYLEGYGANGAHIIHRVELCENCKNTMLESLVNWFPKIKEDLEPEKEIAPKKKNIFGF